MSKARAHPLRPLLALVGLSLLAAGCRQDMHDQPKLEPLEASTFFADGAASRAPVEGTVARGMLRADGEFYTGRTAEDAFLDELPMALDRQLLERGRSRYDTFCSPCHGRLGNGAGMIVQRGFKQPQSFHEPRLQASPIGYFFHVITNGFGQMSDYASQISPEDRWAVAAYVRTLQLSQGFPVDQLSASELEQVEAGESGPQAEPQEAH